MALAAEPTPCGALFSFLKREGGITHRELAGLILSERPLPNGRTPRDLARDRSWLSHAVVHAPADALPERYFLDYGVAAAHVMGRLRSRRGRAMTAEQIAALLAGESGRAMDAALARCHQDERLYRNAVERLAASDDLVPGERAEALLVLMVAAACTADARRSVRYTMDYVATALGRHVGTPSAAPSLSAGEAAAEPVVPTRLGLMRVREGYVVDGPHWLPASPQGVTIGALALGSHDITDVGAGVSGRHVRVWLDDEGRWLVEDLGSKNGSVLVDGASRKRVTLEAGSPVPLRPADELVLAGDTTFVVIEGVSG